MGCIFGKPKPSKPSSTSNKSPRKPPSTGDKSPRKPPSTGDKSPRKPPSTSDKSPPKQTNDDLSPPSMQPPSDGNGQKTNGEDKRPSKTNGYHQKGPLPVSTTTCLLPDANPAKLESFYSIDKFLGRGQFSFTYICTEKTTRYQYLCKSISRSKLQNSKKRDISREVQIMKQLRGQEHIIEFKDAFEDDRWVHLVMELCTGGELLDWIIAKRRYSERDAAAICRAIVNVVYVCHTKGLMLRDIKPENFLFSCDGEGAVLKAIDFGRVVSIQGMTYKEVVGSAYYVAPEVLVHGYRKETDIWSAGIILYILLSGVPPFCAETENGIFKAISKGDFDLDSAPWPSISNSAKELVRKMLAQDPNKRITSTCVLKHPWIKEDGDACDKPIDSIVISSMKKFRAMNKFKKLALQVIARNLSEQDIEFVKDKFTAMDKDKSGTITSEQLKNGLRLSLKGSQFKLLEDVEVYGTIDYIEFIAAARNRCKLEMSGGYIDEPFRGY